MLRRVVEARTKKSGRFSFSDSALRHSRRRWSRACCSGVKVSVGSGVVARGRVNDSVVGELTPGAEAPCSSRVERPKAEALGYLEATVTAGGKASVGDGVAAILAKCGGLSTSLRFGRDDASLVGV